VKHLELYQDSSGGLAALDSCYTVVYLRIVLREMCSGLLDLARRIEKCVLHRDFLGREKCVLHRDFLGRELRFERSKQHRCYSDLLDRVLRFGKSTQFDFSVDDNYCYFCFARILVASDWTPVGNFADHTVDIALCRPRIVDTAVHLSRSQSVERIADSASRSQSVERIADSAGFEGCWDLSTAG